MEITGHKIRTLRKVVHNIPAIVPESVKQVCLAMGPGITGIMQNDDALAWQSRFVAMHGLP
jgi:hypothetical protein